MRLLMLDVCVWWGEGGLTLAMSYVAFKFKVLKCHLPFLRITPSRVPYFSCHVTIKAP